MCTTKNKTEKRKKNYATNTLNNNGKYFVRIGNNVDFLTGNKDTSDYYKRKDERI